MAQMSSVSLKEYLKKYESGIDAPKKHKKKKKSKTLPTGVLVVDEDPIWQKPIKLDEENESDSEEDSKPQADEDIEVKRMKRLELISSKKPYLALSDDGSGWVSVRDVSKRLGIDEATELSQFESCLPERRDPVGVTGEILDLSPPRRRSEIKHTTTEHENGDFSPPRRQRRKSEMQPTVCSETHLSSEEPHLKRLDAPSLDHSADMPSPHKHQRKPDSPSSNYGCFDVSPPRRRRRYDTPSDAVATKDIGSQDDVDLSLPRRRQRRYDTPSDDFASRDIGSQDGVDLSPPRRHLRRYDTLSLRDIGSHDDVDLSPPRSRQRRYDIPSGDFGLQDFGSEDGFDLSPQRRRKGEVDKVSRFDPKHKKSAVSVSDSSSLLRSESQSNPVNASIPQQNSDGTAFSAMNLSPPRKMQKESASATEGKTGLLSANEMKEEIHKQKEEEKLRFSAMDPIMSGKGAEPVYRIQGKRVSKEEYMKLQQGEEKPKEKNLEWGKGLAQKREAETEAREIELEKERPFARTRDDPELDKMLRERIRWGDPMAHLIKRKDPEIVLENLGNDEKMRESGFIIPQDVPSHSWLKRGIDPPPNRYGIKPGRHWDGVDRSNGFENEVFKRQNEKQAREREAYLWSVSEM